MEQASEAILALTPVTFHYKSDATFFFSSRRRHTRYIGDWSSDVCSSDLHLLALLQREQMGHHRHRRSRRSEERRVGKECRSRWSPHHQKKKLKSDHA